METQGTKQSTIYRCEICQTRSTQRLYVERKNTCLVLFFFYIRSCLLLAITERQTINIYNVYFGHDAYMTTVYQWMFVLTRIIYEYILFLSWTQRSKMHSTIRGIINVTTTCKNAVSACLKSVWTIKVFESIRNKSALDDINAATIASSYTPQQDGFTETIDLPEEPALISSVREVTVPTSADNSHAVVYYENVQVKIQLVYISA